MEIFTFGNIKATFQKKKWLNCHLGTQLHNNYHYFRVAVYALKYETLEESNNIDNKGWSILPRGPFYPSLPYCRFSQGGMPSETKLMQSVLLCISIINFSVIPCSRSRNLTIKNGRKSTPNILFTWQLNQYYFI